MNYYLVPIPDYHVKYASYYVNHPPYNATISFFFTADPQFGWGSSYSGNEERYG